uniref:Uncharacterized protein n=1 Tax=Fagus sylvatica TaxID=28930 RepID=A0A2N9HG48_FAGSY
MCIIINMCDWVRPNLSSEARWHGFWLGNFDLGLAWSDHGSMARIAAQRLRGSDLEMVLARDLSSIGDMVVRARVGLSAETDDGAWRRIIWNGRSGARWFRQCWWRMSEDLKLYPARGGALMLGMDSSSRRSPDLWMVY